MNETPLELVFLSVFVRGDDGGETDLSRDPCSPDRETKRWRDKIERPRQKKERKSTTEVERSCSQSFPCAGRAVRNAFLSHGPYPAKDKIHLARIIRAESMCPLKHTH
ncbi:hypothetical protein PAMP_007973 [Pampus punctatissimus]